MAGLLVVSASTWKAWKKLQAPRFSIVAFPNLCKHSGQKQVAISIPRIGSVSPYCLCSPDFQRSQYLYKTMHVRNYIFLRRIANSWWES